MKTNIKFFRIISYFLVALIFISCSPKKIDLSDKIKVVCTIFPEYDWAQNIIGNSSTNVLLGMVIKNGTDLHSFQASASDIIQISTSDIFIFVGGESDKWVYEALNQSKNPKQIVINLMDLLKEDLKVEEENPEIILNTEESSELEYDEHIWLSFENSIKACKAIKEALISLDYDHKDYYENNFQIYEKKLNNLKAVYSYTLKNFEEKNIIVCDRYPFRYLSEEFGINYVAAFNGCSAETEASFETLTFLTNKLNVSPTPLVFVTETSDKKIAKTVIQNSNKKDTNIEVLDSMQSVTLRDAFNGQSYLKIMEKNLEALKKAFIKQDL